MGSWEPRPCFPAGAGPQSACPGLSSSPELPSLASWGDGGSGGSRDGRGATLASGQGNAEGSLPLPRPSHLPAGAARLLGEAGERLAADTDPQGSLLEDGSDHRLLSSAEGCLEPCHPRPSTALDQVAGGASPACGPVAPPRGLRQGDLGPGFCSSHRDGPWWKERGLEWQELQGSRQGLSQGCEGRCPQAGGLQTQDAPLLSALGGYPGFP